LIFRSKRSKAHSASLLGGKESMHYNPIR